jgi:hypothetical protein
LLHHILKEIFKMPEISMLKIAVCRFVVGVIVFFCCLTALAQTPPPPPTASGTSITVHRNLSFDTAPLVNSPSGEQWFTVIQSPPRHGNATGGTVYPTYPTYLNYINAGGGYNGSDSFTYKACYYGYQPQICSNVATINVTVVNQPPNVGSLSFNVHGSALIGPLLTGNVTDPENDTVSINTLQIVSPPIHGNLFGVANPEYKSYGVNPTTYTGSDSFTFSLCDDLGACGTGTVYLNITNAAPVAVADSYIYCQSQSTLNAWSVFDKRL